MSAGGKLILYGSGDAGSQELLSILRAKRVPHEFRDIRDGWNNRANLRAIVHKHRTVPQLYRDDGSYIGADTAARDHLAALLYPAERQRSA